MCYSLPSYCNEQFFTIALVRFSYASLFVVCFLMLCTSLGYYEISIIAFFNATLRIPPRSMHVA